MQNGNTYTLNNEEISKAISNLTISPYFRDNIIKVINIVNSFNLSVSIFDVYSGHCKISVLTGTKVLILKLNPRNQKVAIDFTNEKNLKTIKLVRFGKLKTFIKNYL